MRRYSITVPNNQITVTSAYRTPERNERVGGVSAVITCEPGH